MVLDASLRVSFVKFLPTALGQQPMFRILLFICDQYIIHRQKLLSFICWLQICIKKDQTSKIIFFSFFSKGHFFANSLP